MSKRLLLASILIVLLAIGCSKSTATLSPTYTSDNGTATVAPSPSPTTTPSPTYTSDNGTATVAPSPSPTPAPEPPVHQYSLNVLISPPGSGSVSVSPPGGNIAAGSNITLIAVSSSSYAFDHWDGDASGTEIKTTVTLDSDKKITAYFKRTLFKISLEEAKRILDTEENVTLVDVRPVTDFEEGHILGAVSIPLDKLEDRSDEITPGTKVLVYAQCH